MQFDIARRALLKVGIAGFAGALMTHAAHAQSQATMSKISAHSFTLTAIDGTPMPMAQFAGKVVLLVNTASKCSFTDQYDPLQALYEAYADAGLVIVGIPSNEFGNQEPGTEDDIAKFISGEYAVSFPMAAKTQVKAGNAHPLYQWLGDQAGPMGRPRWNFHKYLIGADGQLIDWYSSMTAPNSRRLTSAIETALAQRTAAN